MGERTARRLAVSGGSLSCLCSVRAKLQTVTVALGRGKMFAGKSYLFWGAGDCGLCNQLNFCLTLRLSERWRMKKTV